MYLRASITALPAEACCEVVQPTKLTPLTTTVPVTGLPFNWMFKTGNAALVQFKVTNTSKQAVKIPSWQLPSGALNSDLFEVYLDGQKVEYIGAMIKRGAVAEADLITLRAGETKLVTADLSQVYDMSQDGEYSVRFKSYLQGAKNEKAKR